MGLYLPPGSPWLRRSLSPARQYCDLNVGVVSYGIRMSEPIGNDAPLPRDPSRSDSVGYGWAPKLFSEGEQGEPTADRPNEDDHTSRTSPVDLLSRSLASPFKAGEQMQVQKGWRERPQLLGLHSRMTGSDYASLSQPLRCQHHRPKLHERPAFTHR